MKVLVLLHLILLYPIVPQCSHMGLAEDVEDDGGVVLEIVGDFMVVVQEEEEVFKQVLDVVVQGVTTVEKNDMLLTNAGNLMEDSLVE